MGLRRATLLLPLAFNDGTAVPPELLGQIEEELYRSYGGWTIVGEVSGAYRMRQTGEKKVEKLIHLWIVLEEDQLPRLREQVAEFGDLLDQEVMFFEVGPSEVEFVKPRRKGKSHD